MMEVRQKISRGFRSEQGAQDSFTLHGLLSRACKQSRKSVFMHEWLTRAAASPQGLR